MELIKKYLSSNNIVFILGLILFLVLITQMKEVAIMVFASFVIAYSLNPIVDRISLRFERHKSVAIVLGSAILLLLICFIPLLVMLLKEVRDFAVSFPLYICQLDHYLHTSTLGSIAKIDVSGIFKTLSGASTDIMDYIINLGTNLGSAFVYLIASVMMIFYIMKDKDLIRSTYIKLFPKHMKPKAKNLYDIITKKIGGYVTGQACAIASVGIIMTVGLLLLNVQYALLLGLITAILDIIPVVGPAIALCICLIANSGSGIFILVMVAVVFSVAQLVENNLVRPYVFGKLLDVHPLMIYIFLFITAKYLGVIGVLFAPAIAAMSCVLIEELYMKNLGD